MTQTLPSIGAAMTLAQLEKHQNWIMDGQRDLELQDFTNAEALARDLRPYAARLHNLLDGHEGELGIHGPFWGFAIDTPDPDVREIVKRRMSQGLDICEVLGATQMVVHSPYSSWDVTTTEPLTATRQSQIDNVHLALSDAVKRAEQMGVVLVIKNVADKNPYDRVALAQSFHSPAIGVSLDTGHAHYAHGATGAPPVDFFVRAAGSMLAHVHLQDSDANHDRHWAPGEGTIRWQAVFTALKQIPAKPRLLLELGDASRIVAAADWLIAEGLAR
jgi:sugar phosphate isomerase/epimerase